MTAMQFKQLKDKVHGLWGNTSKWGNQAYEAAPQIRNAEYRWCDAALDSMIEAGEEHAPSIPKVLRKARELAPNRVVSGTDCLHDFGSWAFVEELEDGSRVGLCRGCRWEKTFVPGELLTDSEREPTASQRAAADEVSRLGLLQEAHDG